VVGFPESTVNYWSKYGSIAFDPGQKAVLTSCVLINRATLNSRRKRNRDKEGDSVSLQQAKEEASINCTFSFTIRRDSYNSACGFSLLGGRVKAELENFSA
jgi:hypothetical protein